MSGQASPEVDILTAILKALVAGYEAYQQHLAEAEAARKEVAEQAAGDLAAVEGPPRAG